MSKSILMPRFLFSPPLFLFSLRTSKLSSPSLFLQEHPLLKDLHSETNSEALNRLTHLSATEDQEALQKVVNIARENHKFE